MGSATECVACRCAAARAELRVWYNAVCSGTSLVGASPETSRPSAESRDSRAGSSEPSEALVRVTSQPPSSSLTLILPDEPGVSPRSNNERPRRQMSSRNFVSFMAAALSHALAGRPSRDRQGGKRDNREQETPWPTPQNRRWPSSGSA